VSNGIDVGEWADLLRREYLSDFVASGGSAVKIGVAADSADVPAVLDAVADIALDAGYPVVRVDSGRTRVQRMDYLFFAIARQIDWDSLAERYLRDRLAENGIAVAEDKPLYPIDAVADAAGMRRADLIGLIGRLVANGILRDYALSREFRTAIALLCQRAVNPQNVSPADADIIKAYLCGEKFPLGALKKLQIYQRIGRHNARALLSSLSRYLRQTGHPGLVVLLDLDTVVRDPPSASPDAVPDPARIRYGRTGVLDTYEVLRQCIDETDETAYLLIVAAAGPDLVDHPRRGLDNYTALKLRTVDDVRDRDRANPLSALVRLARIPEGASLNA
jgi:hypothetical protein